MAEIFLDPADIPDDLREFFDIVDPRTQHSVLQINPKPYKGSHFATMPPALAEVCLKAGSSEKGCCPTCRAPWERVTQHSGNPEGILGYKGVPNTSGTSGSYIKGGSPVVHAPDGVRLKPGHSAVQFSKTRDTGNWSQTCDCPEQDPVPCVVLDPFSGSGTTGYVANREGRNYVGTDLNIEYLPLAVARITGQEPPKSSDKVATPSNVLDLFGGSSDE